MSTDCTKCKCWIRPFEPPEGCYDCCTGSILKFAKPKELTEAFRFPEELAEKVFEIASDDRLNLLSEYRNRVTESEYQTMESLFTSINEKGWSWIQHTLKERIEQDMYALA